MEKEFNLCKGLTGVFKDIAENGNVFESLCVYYGATMDCVDQNLVKVYAQKKDLLVAASNLMVVDELRKIRSILEEEKKND